MTHRASRKGAPSIIKDLLFLAPMWVFVRVGDIIFERDDRITWSSTWRLILNDDDRLAKH